MMMMINVHNRVNTQVLDLDIESSKTQNCEFSHRDHRHDANMISAVTKSIILVYKLCFLLH